MSQLSTKSLADLAVTTAKIAADAVTDTKVKLSNNSFLRARNAANSADVNMVKVNASDVMEFASLPQAPGTPSAANDLVNKSYADAIANGLDVKASVRAATTANITLSGAQTIDGVSIIAGDRVLVKDQTAGAENGIYVAAAGAWARAADADVSAEVTAGMFTFVEEGTVALDTGWVLITNNPIVLATTALVFTQFTGVGAIVAGAGLTKTGSTIDFVTADTSLTVNANDVAVNVAGSSGLQVSSGVKIKPDTVTANTLAITLTADGAGVKYDSASFSETSEALFLAAGVAGAGLALTAGVLSVGVDSVTTKISSDQVVGQSNKKELFTLVAGDITNQYIDMLNVAATDSIMFVVKGLAPLLEGASHDYSVSYTGGAGGKTRITFLNDLATGGASALVATDVVQVHYMYL